MVDGSVRRWAWLCLGFAFRCRLAPSQSFSGQSDPSSSPRPFVRLFTGKPATSADVRGGQLLHPVFRYQAARRCQVISSNPFSPTGEAETNAGRWIPRIPGVRRNSLSTRAIAGSFSSAGRKGCGKKTHPLGGKGKAVEALRYVCGSAPIHQSKCTNLQRQKGSTVQLSSP